MRGTSRFGSLARCAVVFVLGCGPSVQPAPFQPVADMKDLMKAVLEPNAGLIGNALNATVVEGGEEHVRPLTAEEWVAVRNAAVTLAESGNLLLMPSRLREGQDWTRSAHALIDASAAAMRAAQAQNGDGLSEASDLIYAVCSDCHAKYPPPAAAP